MYKIGETVICINNEPKDEFVFWDFISYILDYRKENPLKINSAYTIKSIYTYWGDDGNCYDSIDDTSCRCENTSYILEEIKYKYWVSVFDMTRFVSVSEYRKIKIQKLNSYDNK
jgi:hypothetical protein